MSEEVSEEVRSEGVRCEGEKIGKGWDITWAREHFSFFPVGGMGGREKYMLAHETTICQGWW